MNTRTRAALLMIAAVSNLMLAACKGSDAPGTKTAPVPQDQAQQKEHLKRSFDESKKVAALQVNGESISEFAVLREMNTIAPQYLKSGQKRTPEVDARIRRDALDIVLFQALAVQEARKRGMKVTPDAVDGELRKIRTSAGSDRAYQEYLDRNGLTEAELRKIVEQDALFEQIAAREIDDRVVITEAGLKKRYEAEKAGLKDAAHRQMTFDEAKGLLEQKMRAEAGEKRMKEWEQELKKNARIEAPEQQQKKE